MIVFAFKNYVMKASWMGHKLKGTALHRTKLFAPPSVKIGWRVRAVEDINKKEKVNTKLHVTTFGTWNPWSNHNEFCILTRFKDCNRLCQSWFRSVKMSPCSRLTPEKWPIPLMEFTSPIQHWKAVYALQCFNWCNRFGVALPLLSHKTAPVKDF